LRTEPADLQEVVPGREEYDHHAGILCSGDSRYDISHSFFFYLSSSCFPHFTSLLPSFTFLYFLTVLRIRDVYPGSEFFPSRILDPDQRIQVFTQQIVLKLSEIGFRLFILDPNPELLSSRIQGSKWHRIRIRNTAFSFIVILPFHLYVYVSFHAIFYRCYLFNLFKIIFCLSL
jgi:hypothetical protein